MFFRKKKDVVDEDELIDNLTKDTDASENPKKSSGSAGNIGIEKLEAQINALRETMHAQQERFERHSEEIGELRSTLADREAQIRQLEAKATKASELVAEVQPENLMYEQKKADAKIEAIRGKIENNEIMSNNIIDELKKIKNKVAVFRGTDDILKLNKDVRDELGSIRKVEANIEKRADHVEAIYSTFESNFTLFEKMKDDLSNMSEVHSELKKNVEKSTVFINALPNKDELYNMTENIKQTLDTIAKDKSLYDQRNKAVEDSLSSIQSRTKASELQIDTTQKDTKQNIDAVCKTTDNLEVAVKNIPIIIENQKSVNGHICVLEKSLSKNTERLESLSKLIERFIVLATRRID